MPTLASMVAQALLQRRVVDPEREADREEHRGDDPHHLDPHLGPALGHALALGKRLLQGGDLLLQHLFLRPVPVQREARQQ